VYLFHINTTISPSLSASRTADEQFIVSGKGRSSLNIEGIICQGFALTALTCAAFCGIAILLTFFMHTTVRKDGPAIAGCRWHVNTVNA
jgi:hypothetical protein